MTGDPLKKVRSGQPFQPSAQTWNTFIDAAEFYKRQQMQIGRTGQEHNDLPPGVILLKNESGSDLARFNVLGLGDPIILPSANEDEFKNRVTFRGETTAIANHEGKWALALEPIANNRIGRAALSGVFPARVTFDNATQYQTFERADISAGSTVLKANGAGAAEILWSEKTSGEQWCYVRIGPWLDDRLYGTLDSALADSSTSTVTVAGRVLTVAPWGSLSETIPTGTAVELRKDRFSDQWKAIRVVCGA